MVYFTTDARLLFSTDDGFVGVARNDSHAGVPMEKVKVKLRVRLNDEWVPAPRECMTEQHRACALRCSRSVEVQWIAEVGVCRNGTAAPWGNRRHFCQTGGFAINREGRFWNPAGFIKWVFRLCSFDRKLLKIQRYAALLHVTLRVVFYVNLEKTRKDKKQCCWVLVSG